MAKREYLGEFEQVVLLAVMRLGGDAYGVTIRKEIKERTGRTVSIGAIYPTLNRLEEKGYVSSTIGGSTAERGGRSKRQVTLEPAGLEALKRSRNMIDSLWEDFETA